MNILKNLNSSSINIWQNVRTYMDAAKKLPASFHDKAQQWIDTFSPEASLDQYFFQSITSISSKASTAGKAFKVALKTIVSKENPLGNLSQEKKIKIITGLFLGAILGGGIFFSAQSIIQGKIPGFDEFKPDEKPPTAEGLFSSDDSISSERSEFNESLTIYKNLLSTDETTFALNALGIATLIIGGAAVYSAYNSTMIKDCDELLEECRTMKYELEEEEKLKKRELLLNKLYAASLMEGREGVGFNDGSLFKFYDESETPETKIIITDEEPEEGDEIPCIFEELNRKNTKEKDGDSIAKVEEDSQTQANGWIEMDEEEFSKFDERKKAKLAILFAKLFDEKGINRYIQLQKSAQSDALREIMEQVKQEKIQTAVSQKPTDNPQYVKPSYVYSDDSLKQQIGNDRELVVGPDGIPCVLGDYEDQPLQQQLTVGTQ